MAVAMILSFVCQLMISILGRQFVVNNELVEKSSQLGLNDTGRSARALHGESLS